MIEYQRIGIGMNNPSMIRAIAIWLLTSLLLFGGVNGVSYFLLSSCFGLPGVEDQMVRVGIPFVFFERGGYAGVKYFSFRLLLYNCIAALLASALLLGFRFAWRNGDRE